jgi:dihydrofolate reductase
MAKVIAGMTMSVDGFVTDADGSASRLYPDLAALRDTSYMQQAIAETGAVLMGRRAFEMGDPDSFVGEYEFQVPIFVLTHHPPAIPPKQDGNLTFTFVTDGVESAVSQAKAAAGDRSVQVIGGADVVQQLLDAGLVDELHVDVMPVLLGDGLRLFPRGRAGGGAREARGAGSRLANELALPPGARLRLARARAEAADAELVDDQPDGEGGEAERDEIEVVLVHEDRQDEQHGGGGDEENPGTEAHATTITP